MNSPGEKLQKWLLGFSGWEGEPSPDFVEDGPGNTGLFLNALEETGRRTDLLGNLQVNYRFRFTLYRRMLPGQDNGRWLLDFQDWVQQQNADGLTPYFGDVPGLERIQLQKGSLQEESRLKEGLCTVTLIGDFVKEYEVREN